MILHLVYDELAIPSDYWKNDEKYEHITYIVALLIKNNIKESVAWNRQFFNGRSPYSWVMTYVFWKHLKKENVI